MVTDHLKDAFWEAVIDSLVQFHGFHRVSAKARAVKLRSRIERSNDPAFQADLIYHDEPFHVASRLAGQELDLGENLAEYRTILARRFGHLEGMSAPLSPLAAPRLARGGW